MNGPQDIMLHVDGKPALAVPRAGGESYWQQHADRVHALEIAIREGRKSVSEIQEETRKQ